MVKCVWRVEQALAWRQRRSCWLRSLIAPYRTRVSRILFAAFTLYRVADHLRARTAAALPYRIILLHVCRGGDDIA
jgi:hypothetical protein